jgi:hypothetical protein
LARQFWLGGHVIVQNDFIKVCNGILVQLRLLQWAIARSHSALFNKTVYLFVEQRINFVETGFFSSMELSVYALHSGQVNRRYNRLT